MKKSGRPGDKRKVVDPKLTLVLEGLASEGGHVRASDLQKELSLLLAFLHKAAEAEGMEDSVYYVVTALRHDSPAIIELEPRAMSDAADHRIAILAKASAVVSEVQTGALQRRIDTDQLRALREMARPVGKTLASVSLKVNGTRLTIGHAFEKRIIKIMASEETGRGSIRGMLDSINIHAGSNKFWIYPDTRPSKVRCDFSYDLRKAAIAAVGYYVEVSGLIAYKSAAPFPYMITVERLEVLPQDNLPTLYDIRGIAEKTKVPAEELVRQARNATA